MKVKVESEKVGLKLNIQKMKIMASSPTEMMYQKNLDSDLWQKQWGFSRLYYVKSEVCHLL